VARRVLNRQDLRKQAEAAASQEAVPAPEAPPPLAPPAVKVRKPKAPKPPPRLRARWGVFDGAMKQLAIFDYNRREDADAWLAGVQARAKGPHFIQIVKEIIPEPVPEPAPKPAPAPRKKRSPAPA
jgi:hypothetical protein